MVKVELPKLDGSVPTQYSDFKYKCRAYATALGIAEAFDDSLTAAEWDMDEVPDDDVENVNKLYAATVSALTGDALRIAKGDGQRADLFRAWTNLDAHYASRARGARIKALRNMLNDKQKENESVAMFLATKKQILAEDLNGDVTEDELLYASVVGNILGKYDSLAASLQGQDAELEQLETALKAMESTDDNKNSEEIGDAHVVKSEKDEKEKDTATLKQVRKLEKQVKKLNKFTGKKGGGKHSQQSFYASSYSPAPYSHGFGGFHGKGQGKGKGKGKGKYGGAWRGAPYNMPTSSGGCYVCGDTTHRAHACPKRAGKGHGN